MKIFKKKQNSDFRQTPGTSNGLPRKKFNYYESNFGSNFNLRSSIWSPQIAPHQGNFHLSQGCLSRSYTFCCYVWKLKKNPDIWWPPRASNGLPQKKFNCYASNFGSNFNLRSSIWSPQVTPQQVDFISVRGEVCIGTYSGTSLEEARGWALQGFLGL